MAKITNCVILQMSKDKELIDFLKTFVKSKKDIDSIIKVVAARTIAKYAENTLDDNFNITEIKNDIMAIAQSVYDLAYCKSINPKTLVEIKRLAKA
jgi:hypothetical protein